MEKEYIDRNGLLRTIYAAARRSSLGETSPPYLSWTEVITYVQDAPIEDVVPKLEARWIAKPEMIRSPLARNYYCSNCHHEPIECGKYCPECGARMNKQ